MLSSSRPHHDSPHLPPLTPPKHHQRAEPLSTSSQPKPIGRQGRGIPLTRSSDANRGVLASSLDLVFSYSRSQAFYGENLPSSPSFVARYRNPDEEDGFTDSLLTTEDEEGFSDDVDELEDADSLERLSFASQEDNTVDSETQREPLPRNAMTRSPTHRHGSSRSGVEPTRKTRKFSDDSLRPVVEESYDADDNAEVQELNERSVLLHRKPSVGSYSSFGDATSTTPQPLDKVAKQQQMLGLPDRQLSPIEDELIPGFASSSGISIRLNSAPPFVGTSTFGQTLFNSFNILCGVAILSEPLAFASAGWIGGTILLLFCGFVTNYTAKILTRILLEDKSLLTYNDIGMKAFGPSFRWLISFLFCLELFALSIALVVLFGDSFGTLFPTISVNSFKIIGFFVILPTVFLPYRLLSYTSLVGLVSSLVLGAVVVMDGLIKDDAPGSLSHPMPTSLSPGKKWGLSAGLFMSGFAGHAVMPSLARDMQRPQDFDRMVNMAYLLAGGVYTVIGVVGYLMFGSGVSEEITRDILKTPGYPILMNKVAAWMIAINPIAKFALCTRPLNTMIEHLLGFGAVAPSPSHHVSRQSRSSFSRGSMSQPRRPSVIANPPPHSPGTLKPTRRMSSGQVSTLNKLNGIKRVVSRTFFTAFVVVVAIIVPDFDRVMSFLGAFSAFVICVILPIAAYLSVFKRRLSRQEVMVDYILLFVSVVMAAVGTTYTFLPTHHSNQN